MKKLFYLLLVVLLFCGCEASEQPPASSAQVDTLAADTGYDPELARELGADPYGMKQYVMAFLKAGPNRSQDSTEAAALQRAHLDNIRRLAGEGKLVLAGPFMDDGLVRGIYVFDVKTVEEARELTATDPAIQAGRLEMELHPWYGSAALMRVNELHTRIAEKDI